ncbi:MAG: cadherin domain-containing protein [Kiritimatiellae bacterium]|nr:cadherin domain-containing protein [Kiritimatiellia bacterium]
MKEFAKVLAAGAFWGLAAAAMAAPDLVISSVSLSTNRAYPGDKVTINSVTRNNGDATGWWKYCDVYYYWGTAGNLKAQKIGSGATPNYNEVNGIDKGEEEEDTLSWTIPAGTAPGIYYITCVADAEGEIAESNEGNNSKSVKFTVIGTPSFSGLKWQEPLYVSGGDPVMMYGECANIAVGRTLTIQIYEDDPVGDDLVATLSATVRQAPDGTLYFSRSWTGRWEDDASGDPEYYFKVVYTQDGKDYTATSGQNDGAYLHVSQDRMMPSYHAQKNNFYYDNASTNDPGFRGASSGTVALTDDRIPIILVHGMGGDGKPNTLNYWYGWMNADTNAPLGYFNQAPMSSMYRVYRYVYDTRDFISTNGVRLANFVNSWYAQHPEWEGRQVVVMAHSMGGLVSRYAMNVNTQFAARVHRLVTLGSPHLGAQGANPTWIKYSGPDDNSWFVSGIYNTFDLHNNTAGCFDLAWYATNEIPKEALTTAAINEMGDSYDTELMRKSLQNPFTGWTGMRSKSADNKCVLFGGSSTNKIGDNLRPSWTKAAASEVSTDHLGLWVATKIYRSMSYADGTGVGDNDGLVPLISALMSDSLKCALPTDKNGHPTAAKFNLNELDGQQVDHASYLDVPVTMDAVKAVLLTQVRGYCQPAAAVSAGAAWRLVDNVTGETSPWQRTGVRLPALVPGRSYTVNFKSISEYTKPKDVTFTATKAVTRQVSGTYLTASESNHAPSGLSLSNASVEENAPIGTVVGTLSAYDEDGDALTYALVAGDGDTGNACFSIEGNKLKTAQVFDYEQYPQHFCRIRASDGHGAYTDEAFTIDVIDVDERTPAQETGDAWLNLSWAAVPGADYYEVDVSAGSTDSIYTTPNRSLGTNQFLAGQYWRYEAPGGATTTTSGSVKTSPCWFTYGTTNAHALFGTNGVALVTRDLPLLGASAVAIDFQNANWNGKGTAAVSRVDAYYRVDGGEWQFIGYNQSKATGDGGETNYWGDLVFMPEGAATVAFKLEAPNAWRDSYQRGPYVTTATASLYGQGEFADANVHLEGYPRYVNVTNIQVQNLPADTPYWWHVRANVNGEWVDVGYGHRKTEDTVPAPTGLSVATASSTELTATWTDPGLVDHFEVQLTPVVAAGTPKDLESVPNVNLSGSANKSGWFYSANHAQVSSNWICATTNTDWDYHGLVVAPAPGIQSPALDLSGCESATLRFVARTRGGDNGETGKPIVLYYKVPGGSWTEAGRVTTNSIYINNNNYLHIDLPAVALVDGVALELGVPDATTSSLWSGYGNGVRNVTLQTVGAPAPDYGAETAVALEPVPAPLADAVEEEATATATAKGLDMNTAYYVHVRSVDAWGHASAWVEASGRTAAASAPSAISLSSRSIRENNAVGAYIGLLSAVDADAGDEVTYSLADGEGADDNALVVLSGATVRAAASFKAADGAVRRIRVRATDAQGLWTEASFDLEVLASATPPAGVLVDAETLAAMSAACGVRIVAVEGDGAGGVKTAWEDAAPDGARAVRRYDIYVSTNLAEGFTFLERVEGTEATVPLDGPAKFWTVLAAE